MHFRLIWKASTDLIMAGADKNISELLMAVTSQLNKLFVMSPAPPEVDLMVCDRKAVVPMLNR